MQLSKADNLKSRVLMAKDSGMNLEEAKREAIAILNCMVNAWNKVN